jgi:HD-GYP domain-containing protein (c-di-GMP phosphodiesterase class II)
VSPTLIKSRSQIPPVLNKGPAMSLAAALDVLERFGDALQQCDQAAAQVRLTLESVQESLGADAAYWFPGSGSDKPEMVGQPPMPADWRRDFTCREVAQAADNGGQFVRSYLDPAAKPSAPWPCSAAFVRVRESRGSWLVALSFHPRRIFQAADLKVLMLARRLLLNHRQHMQIHQKLKDSLFSLVRCLTAAIDAKNPYTWGHSERVARIAVRLGKQLGLPLGALSDLYLAGLLHDVGKIGVPDTVLQKPDRLSEDEMALVREHVKIGDQLVSNLRQLHQLRPGVRNHHERWDGGGYPDRLAGEDIPLVARIMALAEGCDAMMAARPYRAPLPPAKIEAILKDGAGQQWDPKVVEAFMECRHQVYSICQRGVGDSVTLAIERPRIEED